MQLRDAKALDVGDIDDKTGSDVDELLDVLMGDEGDADGAGDKQDKPPATTPGAVDPNALISELQALRQDLQEQFSKPADATAEKDEGPTIKLDVPELKDEELGQLAKYKDKLSAIAKAASGEQMKPVVEMIEAISKQINELQAGLQAQHQGMFAQQLRLQVPEVDHLHNDPAFAEYLAKPAPFSGGRTLRELLEDAYKAQNLMAAVEILKGYTERDEGKSKDVATRPPVRAVPGAPAPTRENSDTGDLDERYVQASQRLIELKRAGDLDDEAFQESVMKLRKRYEAASKAANVA